MKKLILGISLSLLLQFGTSHSAIYHNIDTTIPLKCSFSRYHQNRIVVEDGVIAKVIFVGDSVATCIEEESGQVFVKEIYPSGSSSVLSVITETGLVQDVEISFEDRSSEVVILRENHVCEDSLGSVQNCSFEQETGDLIDSILSGKNPKGFCCVDASGESKKVKHGLYMYGIARFESKNGVIYLARLKNTTKKSIFVCENDLCTKNSDWVYIAKTSLPAREEILVLISERRS